MLTYNYKNYERPQEVLTSDTMLVRIIVDEFEAIRYRILHAVHLAEESGLESSLSSLGKAFDDFVDDEVTPIVKLLKDAQDDLDKDSTE